MRVLGLNTNNLDAWQNISSRLLYNTLSRHSSLPKKEVAEGRAAKGMDGGEEIKEGTRDVVIQVWGCGLLVA